MTKERTGQPGKGQSGSGEFESFLAEVSPSLQHGVGRAGVAGSLGGRTAGIDPEKLVIVWPDPGDRIVEELG